MTAEKVNNRDFKSYKSLIYFYIGHKKTSFLVRCRRRRKEIK